MDHVSMDSEVVRRVASLAKLALTEAEVNQLRSELTQIVGYVEQLNEIDGSQWEPLTHPNQVTDSLRSDALGKSLTAEEALSNSPQHDGACFQVPAVLG